MKLSQLNEGLTLLANVGVIAGIVFLAMEVRQNTEMMQAQTRDSVTAKQVDFYMGIGTNEFASDLYFFGRDAGLDAFPTFSDGRAFLFMAISLFRIWENEWYQFDKGLFEEQEFRARSSNWPTLLANPGIREAWGGQRETFSAEFRNYVDSLLAGQGI